MNPTVRWVAMFGAGTALLSAGVLYKIKKGDGALDVHADQKIDMQEAAAEAPPAADDSKRRAQQHYLSGVIFAQKGDLEKAAEEFKTAAALDPESEEISEALRRYGNPVSSQEHADFKAAVRKGKK